MKPDGASGVNDIAFKISRTLVAVGVGAHKPTVCGTWVGGMGKCAVSGCTGVDTCRQGKLDR